MGVKMVDVARYLGVSKATVSLAVNGKPGVNEETRRKVLECMEMLEKNGNKLPQMQPEHRAGSADRMIKVVIMNHRKKVVCDPELDLWSEVLTTFDAQARKMHYIYGLTYMNDTEEEISAVIAECNMPLIAGVILFGTEMAGDDFKILDRINKPIVIYDCEMPEGKYSSVCIDNAGAVQEALRFLEKAGATDIKYLGTGKEIYNFRKRRDAFRNALIANDHMPTRSDIVELGNTIPEITDHMSEWMDSHALPEAFIFENYQISIGVLTALRRRGVRVPEDVKLVGIDEIPEYIMADIPLTQIKIPHADRAVMAMELLDIEIRNPQMAKIKIYAQPTVIYKKSM